MTHKKDRGAALCGAAGERRRAGLGLGPTFVGAASDFHATHPQHSLQIALYALTPFYVIAILIFPALARVLRLTDSLARTPAARRTAAG